MKKLKIILLILLASIQLNQVLAWQIERPWRGSGHGDFSLPSFVGKSATDGVASVGLGVHPYSYVEYGFHQGYSYVALNITATANSRKHISYICSNDDIQSWLLPGDLQGVESRSGEGMYDDDAFEVPLVPPEGIFAFRFWGGAGDTYDYKTNDSAEYTRVWISTNGFLTFYESSADASTPTNIPDSMAPNTIIAGVWADLEFDAYSSIYWGWYGLPWRFVVTWNYVREKQSQNHLYFQIILEDAAGYDTDFEPVLGQSEFQINYKGAPEIGTDFAWGIENQEGIEGLGGLCPGSELDDFDDRTLFFQQTPDSSNFFLDKIEMRCNDTCLEDTAFYVDDSLLIRRGYNVELGGQRTFDESRTFSGAFIHTDPLLEAIGGLVFGEAFLSKDVAYAIFPELFISETKPIQVLDSWDPGILGALVNVSIPHNEADLNDPRKHGSTPVGCAVDAWTGITVLWEFGDDTHDKLHNLTIEAKVRYYEFTHDGTLLDTPLYVTTSVNLKVTPDSPDKANNNSFEDATELEEGAYTYFYADQKWDVFDFFTIYADSDRTIRVEIDVDSDDNLNLFLYDSSEEMIDNSTNGKGQKEFVKGHQEDYPGDWWYIMVNATWEYGFYNLTVVTFTIGDIKWDGSVDTRDAILLANAFGYSEGQEGYNWDADLCIDNKIDILDAIKLANHFGDTGPEPQDPEYPGGQGFGGEGLGGESMMLELDPSISVNPSQLTAFKDEVFSVDVKVSDVTDLYGWEFKLYWNSTILNCTDVQVHTPSVWEDNTLEYAPGLEAEYNTTHCRYWKALTAANPAPSFNGTMTVVTLTFKAMEPGTTSLLLQGTILGNSTADSITHTVTSGSATVCYGRYMRGDTHTMNGLNAYILNATKSSTTRTFSDGALGHLQAQWGIRAWIRHANGVEQEISLDGQTGTPKAVVSRWSGGGIQSNTVTMTETQLQPTDTLVVRVYMKLGSGSWTLCATFTTEQLGSTTLEGTTWTVYYYTYAYYNWRWDVTTAKFYWGTSTYSSRIQNLQYT